MPTTYQTPTTRGGRTRSASHRRQAEALALRTAGLPYSTIAQRLGYANPGAAAGAVRAAQQRTGNAAVSMARRTTSPMATAAMGQVPSNRTFGAECEFFGITPQVAVQALAAAGITAVFEGYTHAVTRHWKIVTDASVNRTGTGTGGLELVSPVLRGANGLAELAKAVKALAGAGARVDRTCGVHIHIGMDGLNGAQIMNVVDYYAANQSHINGLVARSRLSSGYCRPANQMSRYTMQAISQARQATNPTQIRDAFRNGERYYSVNVTSYAKYGTLEFRQHQGSLNGKKLTNWVKFLLATVENGLLHGATTHGSLAEMVGALNLDAPTQGYLTSRAVSLARSARP